MKKSKKRGYFYGIFSFILLILLYASFYVVYQGQEALQFRLGKLVAVADPGLHAQYPFLDQVKFFDTRLQTFNVESSKVLTADQQYLKIGYYVEWHIQNAPLFYLRTGGDPAMVLQSLQRNISDNLRAAIVQHTLTSVIVDSGQSLQEQLLLRVAPTAQALGVVVTDVRLMRVGLPANATAAVLQRMRTDNEKITAMHQASTQENAATIRAAGDAKAAAIYAEAYSKNPEFYAFYHSLEAYQKVFSNKANVIVLQPDSGFFKYFNSPASKQ